MKGTGRRAADQSIEKFARPGWIIIAVGIVATILAYLVAPRIHSGIANAGPLIAFTGILVSLVCGLTNLIVHTGRVTQADVKHSQHMANHDPLTGLPNRVGLLRHLESAISEMERENTALGVLFLDLDRFKVINDTMGHDAGDALLRVVGERLVTAVRSTDLVARFGGDEFVVVSRGLMSTESLVQIARQILKAFEQPLPMGSGDMVVSPSIGIAYASRRNPRNHHELVRDADAAMYRAKRARTGYAIFDEQQRADALTKLDTEQGLRNAIEESELDVFYQPIIDAKTRRLASLEALVRWNRPGHGIVGPNEFLTVAEEAGLMASLGEVVLKEATAQAAIWTHTYWQGLDVKIGVNVAERQLIDYTFAHQVERILTWAGLPASSLTIEITEDVIVDHLDSSLTVLRDLKSLGVSLAIDDFGTGRSSLAYVKRLDMIDYLKIDKSFVQGLNDSAVNLAIVEAIVAMAKALGLTLVAEGVESNEHFELLASMGVDRMQGYLFEKPLAAHELEAKMSGRAPTEQQHPKAS